MSVIQLNNGEIHNVFELKDIKDLVDYEVYEFIVENTIKIQQEENEDTMYELNNEIHELENETEELKESMNWVYNHLNDLLEDMEEMHIEENDREDIIKYIKDCKSSLD